MDDLDVAGENSPQSPPNGHSGITLVLPSLRALKAANAGKKPKPKQATADLDPRPKVPRPIKLKPLKEVLAKLITQIKKKDDYAFFIQPVNPAQVPGYADLIKTPMDFGTMSLKVSKGKYRSLEDFTNDFRLVTANAKAFNPLGSIYYAEADRIEAWGLDHITRASAHVIEYETDWNIDVEQDDDGSTSQLPVNVEDEVSTPRDVDSSMAAGSRAPSTTPAPGQASALGTGRRGPRGPYKKHAQTALSEGLDAEGRMPGAKDGVGAFPAGSDWAELMIALKIKGKRYKTKKERLRFEKEGPPYHADGSIDYAEMEDPFSVLNVLLPDAPSRPQVTPLYPPPLSATTPVPTTTADGAQPQYQTRQSRVNPPIPITVPSNHPTPILSTVLNPPVIPVPVASTSIPSLQPPKKRRHWTIIRNAPARQRAKDKEAESAVDDTRTGWKVPRDAGPTDYGTFATLLGELASAAAPNTGPAVGTNAAEYIYGSEQRLFATIRSTVEHRGVKRKRETEESESLSSGDEGEEKAETFWTDERAEEAWDYLRDVVYGGVDGYAYVRSLAEFLAPSVYLGQVREEMEAGEDEPADEPKDASEITDVKPPSAPRRNPNETYPLGVPLARYVEDNLIDMVTRVRHGWLRDVFLPILSPYAELLPMPWTTTPFHIRLDALPGAASFKAWYEEPLDMAALIRKPEELAKEGVLEGSGEEEGRNDIDRALAWSAEVIAELDKQPKIDAPIRAIKVEEGDVMVKEEVEEDVRVAEEEEEGSDVMDVDVEADSSRSRSEARPKSEADADAEEDPLVKRLRMNLLALAKRAPLDRIARLPVELVPESIRGIVPTA